MKNKKTAKNNSNQDQPPNFNLELTKIIRDTMKELSSTVKNMAQDLVNAMTNDKKEILEKLEKLELSTKSGQNANKTEICNIINENMKQQNIKINDFRQILNENEKLNKIDDFLAKYNDASKKSADTNEKKPAGLTKDASIFKAKANWRKIIWGTSADHTRKKIKRKLTFAVGHIPNHDDYSSEWLENAMVINFMNGGIDATIDDISLIPARIKHAKTKTFKITITPGNTDESAFYNKAIWVSGTKISKFRGYVLNKSKNSGSNRKDYIIGTGFTSAEDNCDWSDVHVNESMNCSEPTVEVFDPNIIKPYSDNDIPDLEIPILF